MDASGNVLACLFTNLIVGNIKEKTLKEIWAEVISSPFFSQIHDPANLKGDAASVCTTAFAGVVAPELTTLRETGWLLTRPAVF